MGTLTPEDRAKADDAGLHPDAFLEYGAISEVADSNAPLANALVEFWRMWTDIRLDPELLNELEPLLRAAGDDDGTVFRALSCSPDTEGIVAIIGEKGGLVLVLSLERFETPLAESIWKDAQSSANGRASSRAVTVQRNGR